MRLLEHAESRRNDVRGFTGNGFGQRQRGVRLRRLFFESVERTGRRDGGANTGDRGEASIELHPLAQLVTQGWPGGDGLTIGLLDFT